MFFFHQFVSQNFFAGTEINNFIALWIYPLFNLLIHRYHDFDFYVGTGNHSLVKLSILREIFFISAALERLKKILRVREQTIFATLR